MDGWLLIRTTPARAHALLDAHELALEADTDRGRLARACLADIDSALHGEPSLEPVLNATEGVTP